VGKTLDVLMHYALEHRVLDQRTLACDSESPTIDSVLFKLGAPVCHCGTDEDLLRVVQDSSQTLV
jgi:hypothetical protein